VVNMISCEKQGKLFGCRFQPRYEKVTPSADQIEALANGDSMFISADAEYLIVDRYLGDVCIRCGRTVKP